MSNVPDQLGEQPAHAGLLKIALRNDLAEIERLSLLISSFVARHELPAKLAFDLNLALDEILTNVISYGYPDAEEHTIEVRCNLADAGLTVEVEDDARPFNPLDTPPPDLDAALSDRPIGGLGVFLVRKLMDRLEYRRQDGKNLLIMEKSL